MILIMLTARVTLALYQWSSAFDHELTRINYGVTLQRISILELATDYLVHTFEVRLPSLIPVCHLFGCQRDKNTCNVLKVVLRVSSCHIKLRGWHCSHCGKAGSSQFHRGPFLKH